MGRPPEPTASALTADDEGPAAAGAAQLIVALEYGRPAAAPSRHALADLHEVRIGRGDQRAVRERDAGVRRLVLGVPDRAMSVAHAQLLRVRGRWIFEDAGSKNGSSINGGPVARAVLMDGDRLELGHTLFIYRDALPLRSPEIDDLDGDTLDLAGGTATFVASLGEELARLARVAASEVPVVVTGESGTGKELAARAVHERSGRPGAFVPVNCGAIPPGLVEATLFGHRRGAFSGAVDDRPGLVRSAERGTLFLDEIGDLPAAAQTALLRVLEQKEIQPVGDPRPTRVDFRLVCATQRPLAELVAEGRFRADLLARVSGFVLRLPPLRERRDDLGLIICALLRRLPGRHVTLHPRAARALVAHDWPLNARELERCLASALALCEAGQVRLGDLPEALRASLEPADQDERLRAELVALLGEHRGNVSEVARTLGKGRMQIHRWLKRFGLMLDEFRR